MGGREPPDRKKPRSVFEAGCPINAVFGHASTRLLETPRGVAMVGVADDKDSYIRTQAESGHICTVLKIAATLVLYMTMSANVALLGSASSRLASLSYRQHRTESRGVGLAADQPARRHHA
jgi:hypothetical protein